MTIRQIVPNTITLCAMLAGFMSILVTIEGILHTEDAGAKAFQHTVVVASAPAADAADDPAMAPKPHHYFRWAALLIMLAMILDGLDGNVARWTKGESDFGAELDTYVDLTAFGLAPAILIFAVTLHTQPVWRVILPSAVCLSGVVRLARFKAKDPLRGQGGYAGLPITANAAWVALFVFITQTPPLNIFSLNNGSVAILFLVGVVTFIVLQVTNLRYPKPTKNAVLFGFCSLVVVCFLCFGMSTRFARYAVHSAVAMIVIGVAYIVFGPLFVKSVQAHKARKDARTDDGTQDGE